MRLDQMDGAGRLPERRKVLGDLERKVLLSALSHLKSSDAEECEKHYVIDIAMAMPSGFLDRLWYAVARREPRWPGFKPDPEQWEPSPIELIGYDSTDAGLWSILPLRLYRKTTRHGESPDAALIGVTSEVLDFGDWCSKVWYEGSKDAWPDVPPLRLFIESTHYLVASQRFEDQEDGDKWLTLLKETFNSVDFVKALQRIDARMEEESGPKFKGPYLLTRLEEKYCGWMPGKGLPTENVRAMVSHLRASRIQNPDRTIAMAFASLRDRGYVLLDGQFQSPDTRWVFPAQCLLTGTGYARASRLASE